MFNNRLLGGKSWFAASVNSCGDKHSHRGWFQVSNMVSLKVEWRWAESHSWALGSLSNLITVPPLIYLTSLLLLDTSSWTSLFPDLGEFLRLCVRGWVRVHTCDIWCTLSISTPESVHQFPLLPSVHGTRGVWNWNLFCPWHWESCCWVLPSKSGKAIWG